MGRKLNKVTVGFIALILLVVTLLMAGGLRRNSHVTLPSIREDAPGTGDSSQYNEDVVNQIEITPETVQFAVETLERPDSYMRLMLVEWLWGESTSLSPMTVSVNGELTRIDVIRPDGRTRRVLTDGKRTAIWYDDEENYYLGAAGDITVDQEQSIPTYEDILQLDPGSIAAADYRVFSGDACIYVETVPDASGIVLRYWVSIASGLLTAAERLQNGTVFYHMTVQVTTSENQLTPESFLLPDGTSLLQ